MTAPNPARDAQPGQRFTDPKGGTWVLTDMPGAAWFEVKPNGWSCWHRQEEAEKAGLVPVSAEIPWDRVEIQNGALVLTDSDAPPLVLLSRIPGWPASVPLDPSNPDDLPDFDWNIPAHLRWLASAMTSAPLPQWEDADDAKDMQDAATAEEFARFWRDEADRLGRERAEQAQDEADRKLAEVYADACWTRTSEVQWEAAYDGALHAIRAERARASAEDAS